MGSYFLALNKYEVLKSFNVPPAHAPHAHAICLEVGDVIIAIEGDIYVKMDSTQRELCSKSNDNYVKAVFDEKFVEFNPKFFKLL